MFLRHLKVLQQVLLHGVVKQMLTINVFFKSCSSSRLCELVVFSLPIWH